jgi:hypothetical protein
VIVTHSNFSILLNVKNPKNEAMVLKCKINTLNKVTIRRCKARAGIERIKASYNRLFFTTFQDRSNYQVMISCQGRWPGMVMHVIDVTPWRDHNRTSRYQFLVFTSNNSCLNVLASNVYSTHNLYMCPE